MDVNDFDGQVRDARARADEGRLTEAVGLLTTALALWRGPVLSDVGGALIESAALALGERRLAAPANLLELPLASGGTRGLISDLRVHTNRHPSQEALRGQLMRALYHSGRRAEALEEYGRLKDQLAEELGIDPGPQLIKLYSDILRDELPMVENAITTVA